MTHEQKKLAEKMVNELQGIEWDKDDCILAVGKEKKVLLQWALRDIAALCLSVVLDNIGDVAECCDCAKGKHYVYSESDKSVTFTKCDKCRGSGVVAKGRI